MCDGGWVVALQQLHTVLIMVVVMIWIVCHPNQTICCRCIADRSVDWGLVLGLVCYLGLFLLGTLIR